MSRRRRERGRASARVADEMKAHPAARVGLPEDARDLGVEAVVRRWSIAGVDLELLGDDLDLVTENVDERAVGEIGGQDGAREQDYAMDGSSFGASTSSIKASTTGCAGSIA